MRETIVYSDPTYETGKHRHVGLHTWIWNIVPYPFTTCARFAIPPVHLAQALVHECIGKLCKSGTDGMFLLIADLVVHLPHLGTCAGTTIEPSCTGDHRPSSCDDVMYLLTTVLHPHGHWQLQELLGNQNFIHEVRFELTLFRTRP